MVRGAADVGLEPHHRDVLEDIFERGEREQQPGRGATLDRHAQRGEDERRHDHADVEAGQDAKRPRGQVRAQPRVADPTRGDEKARDREEPVDADTEQQLKNRPNRRQMTPDRVGVPEDDLAREC